MKAYHKRFRGPKPGAVLRWGLLAWLAVIVALAASLFTGPNIGPGGFLIAAALMACVFVWIFGIIASFAALVCGRGGWITVLALGVNLLPIVLAILPSLFHVHSHHPNFYARRDALKALCASQAYFKQHPQGVLDLAQLEKYGFHPSMGVQVQILDGKQKTFALESRHEKGEKTCRINRWGDVFWREP